MTAKAPMLRPKPKRVSLEELANAEAARTEALMAKFMSALPSMPPTESAPGSQVLNEVAHARKPAVAKEDEAVKLPEQRFQVAVRNATVREAPQLDANVLGTKGQGSVVLAVEETFDGWVKLAYDHGWMQRYRQLKILDPVNPACEALAILADASGPQHFEVAFKPSVEVRKAPNHHATLVGNLRFGETVEVESRTFHGWLRLAAGAGWVFSERPEQDNLLHPTFVEAIAVAREWPKVKFKVSCTRASVRQYPRSDSALHGVKLQNDIVVAVEETFDGWIRLDGGLGWIQRERWDSECSDIFLEPLEELLLANELTESPGRRMFEVVNTDRVIFRRQPTDHALGIGHGCLGNILLAETQTYHGWVRLAGDEGWVSSYNGKDFKTLRCISEEEQDAERERDKSALDKCGADSDHDLAEREAAVERSIVLMRESNWLQRLLDSEGQVRELKPCGKLPMRPPEQPTVSNPLGLPMQEFIVLSAAGVPIRQEANDRSAVIGMRRPGEAVHAIEETFDGWISLADAPGWILRRDVLEPVSQILRLAIPVLSDSPGRHMFEVVAEQGIHIRAEPSADAATSEEKAFGEFVLCETQTYHGWVRLADDVGWLPCSSEALGGAGVAALLHPVFLEEQAVRHAQACTINNTRTSPASSQTQQERCIDALQQLSAARLTGDASAVRAAVEQAKSCGVSKREIAKANAGL